MIREALGGKFNFRFRKRQPLIRAIVLTIAIFPRYRLAEDELSAAMKPFLPGACVWYTNHLRIEGQRFDCLDMDRRIRTIL